MPFESVGCVFWWPRKDPGRGQSENGFLSSLPAVSGTSESLYTFITTDVNELTCLPSAAVCRRDCTMEADTLEVQTSSCLLAPGW